VVHRHKAGFVPEGIYPWPVSRKRFGTDDNPSLVLSRTSSLRPRPTLLFPTTTARFPTPQLSAAEQTRRLVLYGKGKTPLEICGRLAAARRNRAPPAEPPDVTTVRRFLHGFTHKGATTATSERSLRGPL
jgi:hypothetical protein